MLVTAVVGSGAAAAAWSDDAGIQLLAHALAVAATLAVLILLFGPLSGAHFNPVVTLVEWWYARRRRPQGAVEHLGYLAAQICGGVAGAVLANVMFDAALVALSATDRAGPTLWLGEVVATAGLVLVIGGLVRTGRASAVPFAVGAWIAAAIWFTASAAFANPAVTVGRMLTDTATGIAPASVPGFVVAQCLGAALGAGLVCLLWPGKDHPS